MGQRVKNGELEFFLNNNEVMTLNKNPVSFKASSQAKFLSNTGVYVQI